VATRVGVDIGGTFTDLVAYDDATGEVRVAKVPTIRSNPEDSVISAVRAGVPPELLAEARYFQHGTTIGLNALIEREGPPVGLLATRGLRDVLDMKRGTRPDPYNLLPPPPDPLVPRRLRLPVGGRILASGEIYEPLVESDIGEAFELFRSAGVECVAVAFINSYVNPEHELAAEVALRSLGFTGDISLSHRISRERGEYERTATTVVDAFVRPSIARYVHELETNLCEEGFTGAFLMARSGGGAITFDEARARPFETLASGPVAGCQGAAELGRALGLGDVITADVGGTSFDTSLIVDGKLPTLFEGEVAGLTLQSPWVDVRSIGAGGGSIATVDAGGLLAVGPQSAGANPGPACYGRGGTLPTVTDAAFWLGMLGPGELAAGITLDRDLAEQALRPLADALRVGLAEAARGVITLVSANMAEAIREITIERGQDPREATLVSFGGAGPLFGTLLAGELDIPRIVVPVHGGIFSAWGLMGADIVRTKAQSLSAPVDDAGIARANEVAAELAERLAADLDQTDQGAAIEVALDIRYIGQAHAITVDLPAPNGRIDVDAGSIVTRFNDQYRATFGVTLDEGAELTTVRVTSRTALPARNERPTVGSSEEGLPRVQQAFSFNREAMMDFALWGFSDLVAGEPVDGPAVILSETQTIYVDADFVARLGDGGALFIEYRRTSAADTSPAALALTEGN
jgi:N-methylhydantoinase A